MGVIAQTRTLPPKNNIPIKTSVISHLRDIGHLLKYTLTRAAADKGRLLRFEMTLGWMVAFISRAHDQQRLRGGFTDILPKMRQVGFEEQAVTRIEDIDTVFDGIG